MINLLIAVFFLARQGNIVRYNDRVHMRYVVTVVVLSAGMVAQSAPPACPADGPVDDIIAAIHNQQSKKKHRNSNPLPESICILGWCKDTSRTPPTFPEPAPRVEKPSNGDSSSRSTSLGSVSASKGPQEPCDEKMEIALKAAHDVDVGDYYFEEKKYNAALQRYNDALEEKPGDIAIHVRLGRVLEKMNQLPQAIEQYQAAQKLAGPEKWSEEAKSALQRLQPPPGL
jgi:tetratricopeptide (TPR) repeat protein